MTDGKGGRLPGMKVFAEGPGVKREAATDAEGQYRFEVPAGTYEVRAGTDCTQTFYQKDVGVAGGKTNTLNIVIPLYRSYASSISIYQLLAAPEKYHNRLVTVAGYYHYGPELSALFASKDDADYLIGKNSLWVSFGPGKLELEANNTSLKIKPADINYYDGKYVSVQGIFNKGACGHLGMSSGEIKEVTRVVELRRYFVGKKKR